MPNYSPEKYRKNKSSPYCGSTDPYSAGNEHLMRITPVIIAARDEKDAAENALLQTRFTRGCAECLQYSEAFARKV
jgi:ADP-ribosyl-[dinitrogen reductase] hydrolase